jgi:hypothetical protein
MKLLNDLLKAEKKHQMFLGIVFIIYILLNIRSPHGLAELIDTTIGNIVVVCLALTLFSQTNSIIGVLGCIVAYLLIKRSSIETGSHAVRSFLSSENAKTRDFSKYNQFPKTLEEEVVAKMSPLVKHAEARNSKYTPVLDEVHNASPLNYTGVI